MSTADKLNALVLTKADIKLALIDKGLNPSDVFSTYADDIRAIETGSGSGGVFDFAAIGYTGNEEPLKSGLDYAKEIYNNWDNSNTSMKNMFKNDSIYIFPNINTSLVTDMSYAFEDCSLNIMPYIDASSCTTMVNMFKGASVTSNPCINTSLVTDTTYMFNNCLSISNLDFSRFNTDSCIKMLGMFSYSNIKTIVLPDNFGNVCTNFLEMFLYCTLLESVGVIKSDNATTLNNMFGYCDSLIRIESISAKKLTDMTYMSILGFKNPPARYFLCKDIATQPEVIKILFGYYKLPNWGIEDSLYPLSAGARQSVIDTLITYSFDRATAEYDTCTITLHANTKALLTEDEIAQITAKGYTIA